MASLDPALAERFRADMSALAATNLPRGSPERRARPLGLAVSGGPDSLAMLLLAHAAFPGHVLAATVDHRLRTESAAEAAMVGKVCRGLAIPHTILSASVRATGQGLQAAARAARYAALGLWAAAEGADALATAHHADDQAETMLMRLSHGSGLGGLAGIRRSRPLEEAPEVRLVRPLLGWRKAELLEIVRRAGLEPAADPSNRDPAYDRTHVRALLAREPLLDAGRIAASAGALADAEEALDWLARRLLAERVTEAPGGRRLDVADLPRELRRRLLAALLPGTRGDALARLLDRLDAGRPGTLDRWLVRPDGAIWHVGEAPPRRSV